MTTSSRARSFRRSLFPQGPLLASAVLLLLASVAARAQSEAPPPPVEAEVEGYWLKPIARGSEIVPCGHGHHAWVWTPGRVGLRLVDAEGRELTSVSFGDKTGGAILHVVPTADPERAWVQVQVFSPSAKVRSQVFLVDHQGTARGLLDEGAFELALTPTAGRERLWALSEFDSQLRVIDATGRVEVVSLSPSGQGLKVTSSLWWTTARTVMPVAEGRQGWLVLDQGLHFVDLDERSPTQPAPARDARHAASSPPGGPRASGCSRLSPGCPSSSCSSAATERRAPSA